jgi:hypothetical protein
MRHPGIEDDLGARTRRGERTLHALHGVVGNAGILAAVQAQDGRLQLGGHVDRMARRERRGRFHERPIPGDCRLHARVVRGVEPGDAPAPAEAGDAEPARVASITGGPLAGGVEVGHHLGIGHGRNDLADGVDLEVGYVALASVQVGRHREVALPREAPAEVAKVLVHAPDLVHQDDGGQGALSGGSREVGGDGAVTRRDARLAGVESLRVGVDRGLGLDRLHCRGESRRERRHRLSIGGASRIVPGVVAPGRTCCARHPIIGRQIRNEKRRLAAPFVGYAACYSP